MLHEVGTCWVVSMVWYCELTGKLGVGGKTAFVCTVEDAMTIGIKAICGV